jgi:hypothetical protein
LRFLWKPLTSCGSGDSISNGRGMKQNDPMQEAKRPKRMRQRSR